MKRYIDNPVWFQIISKMPRTHPTTISAISKRIKLPRQIVYSTIRKMTEKNYLYTCYMPEGSTFPDSYPKYLKKPGDIILILWNKKGIKLRQKWVDNGCTDIKPIYVPKKI